MSILDDSISRSTKQAVAHTALQLHLAEITSLRFYRPSRNAASHLATCWAAGSRDTGALGLRGDAGFKKHKAQIPAQCGWPQRAGEQPCYKGYHSIHLASGKKMAERGETVQGRHSTSRPGRLGATPTNLVSCPQLRQLLRKGLSESLRLFFSVALTQEDYRNVVSPPPWIPG